MIQYQAFDRKHVNPKDWDAFVDEQDDAWVWQRSWWLDYIQAYDPEVKERSFIVCDHHQRVRAIVPLFVKKDRVGYGQGDPCPGMVIDLNDTLFERNALTAMIFAECRRRLQDVSSGGWQWWANAQGARKWAKYCAVSFPVEIDFFRSAVIDLQQPQDTLWKNVRKTYRHIIRDNDDGAMVSGDWPGYIDCHIEAAPGARPTSTYAHNAKWGASGKAHAVCARYDGHPVAAAYALIDKGWAYYASGPSTKRNVQHAVQWRMILDLKRKGVRWYEMGNVDAVGEKEERIAFFKRGFSKDVRAVYGAHS